MHLVNDDPNGELPACPECGDELRGRVSNSYGQLAVVCAGCGGHALSLQDGQITPAQMTWFRPMCAATFHPKHKLAEKMMHGDGYIKERKLNGERVEVLSSRNGTQIFTRTISKVTNLPIEKTEWLPHLNWLSVLDRTLLDAELLTRGPRADHTTIGSIMNCDLAKSLERQKQFGRPIIVVFDILVNEGEDVRSLPLHERITLRDEAVKQLREELLRKNKHKAIGLQYIYLVDTCDDVKKVWREGGEGIIIKDLSAPYWDGNGSDRPAGVWMKLKREIEVDLVIMGYEDANEISEKSDGSIGKTKYAGMVGSVKLGVYDGRNLVHITDSSGFSDKFRKMLTDHGKKYIGEVVRVKAQGVLKAKDGSLSLQNPRIQGDKVRKDKNATDCKYTDIEEELI